VRYLPPVRVAHGKVAEFQTRGVVHFHALLRLDGTSPHPDQLVPPPAGITIADLDDAIRHAATHTAVTTPTHPDQPAGWPIRWGQQLDIRHITTGIRGDISDGMVAGYLAKYATKSTETTGHTSLRLTNDTIDQHADDGGDHTARLIAACWRLGRPTHPPVPLLSRPRAGRPATRLRPPWTCPICGTRTRLAVCLTCHPTTPPAPSRRPTGGSAYAGLRRWAHMLGFGGHFLTKTRRYSVTFTALRASRTIHRRAETTGPTDHTIRAADHTGEETTLIVGALTFAGVGWHTTGDALLANTSADLARCRRVAGREELAHEIGIQKRSGSLPTAA